MSYLPAIVTCDVGRFVRTVLERSKYRRATGTANVRQAAHDATAAIERQASALGRRWTPKRGRGKHKPNFRESNRRLLHRLAYGDRATKLTEDAFNRVCLLLGQIEQGANERCYSLAFDADAVNRFRRAQATTGAAYGPPTLFERFALDGTHTAPASLRQPLDVRRRYLPGMPNGLPRVVIGRVEAFQRRMREQGHSAARVDRAVKRFYAAFCAFGRTDGVERGFHEMTPREQQQVVDWGLGVEELWLGPNPAYQRTFRSTPLSAEDTRRVFDPVTPPRLRRPRPDAVDEALAIHDFRDPQESTSNTPRRGQKRSSRKK